MSTTQQDFSTITKNLRLVSNDSYNLFVRGSFVSDGMFSTLPESFNDSKEAQAHAAINKHLDAIKAELFSLTPWADGLMKLDAKRFCASFPLTEDAVVLRVATWLFDCCGSHPNRHGMAWDECYPNSDEAVSAYQLLATHCQRVQDALSPELADKCINAHFDGNHDT